MYHLELRHPGGFLMIECILRTDSFAVEADSTLRQSDDSDAETVTVTPSSRYRHP